MKQKVLLLSVAAAFTLAAHSQKRSANVTAYAITSAEKGSTKWAEVKLVDIITGEEVRSVYQSSSEVTVLNARTKKPVERKEPAATTRSTRIITTNSGERIEVKELSGHPGVFMTTEPNERMKERRVIRCVKQADTRSPFATNSAACAYDKKHDRLYYTPMGVNQLRYIDLKETNPVVYYFEDEPFGALNGPGDVQNQVTRMTIGSDGDGYALTNNAEHLIRFNTNKKAKITDLGAVTDDASNGKYSIRSKNGYGGDMVADDSKNLYVITGNRMVFKIDTRTMVATYKGTIKGLPSGFTTNGAAVEEGTSIIVTSSTNSSAYYKFSLADMKAEKISTGSSVYNASDLANSNLIKSKKLKKDEPVATVNDTELVEAVEEGEVRKAIETAKISVYPNPVSTGAVKVSFQGYEPGIYEIQLIDLNGKAISSLTVTINSKTQIIDYKLPSITAKGTYLLRTTGNEGKVINLEKIVVQ